MNSIHKRVAPSSSVEILSSDLLSLNLPNKKKKPRDIFSSHVNYEETHLAFGKNLENLLGTRDFCRGDGTVSRFGAFDGKHSFRPDTLDRAVVLVEVENQDFDERPSLLEVPVANVCESPLDKGPVISGQFVKLLNHFSNVEYDELPCVKLLKKQSTMNLKPVSQPVKALMPSKSCNKRADRATGQGNGMTQAFNPSQGKRLDGNGNARKICLGHTSDRNIEKLLKTGNAKIAGKVNQSKGVFPVSDRSTISIEENHVPHYKSKLVGNLGIELVLEPEGGIKERSLQLACSSGGGIAQHTENMLKVENCLNLLEQFGLFKSYDEIAPHAVSAPAPRPGIVGDGVLAQKCKICGKPEDANGTLICDVCEQVFHVACCQPKVRTVPLDDMWTCIFCKRKDKRRKKKGNRSLNSLSSKGYSGSEVWKREGDTNSFVWDVSQLRSNNRIQIRIGTKYQAEVPEWTGKTDQMLLEANVVENVHGTEIPLSLEDKIREKELAEKHLVDNVWPKGWLPAKSLPVGSRQNWLQCQHIIYDEGQICPDGTVAVTDIICGKWRRAPVEVEAVKGWECSCAIIWDPRHADCVVPQELPTEEIQKHRRFHQAQIEVASLALVNIQLVSFTRIKKKVDSEREFPIKRHSKTSTINR